MIAAWRLVKAKRATAAFSGEGARLAGGRWNRPGTPVVYVSAHVSLAVLELFVHLDATSRTRLKLVTIPVRFPEKLVEDVGTLPREWRAEPPPEATMDLGTSWAESEGSAVLRVTSAVVPDEHNFVLNPAHPDFQKIEIGAAQPYSLDPEDVEVKIVPLSKAKQELGATVERSQADRVLVTNGPGRCVVGTGAAGMSRARRIAVVSRAGSG